MDHGGDLLSYRDFYDGELIDFSSNINPLGAPRGLKEYLFENFSKIEVYPDSQYRELKENLKNYLGCETENIIVGNGAMEIIDIFITLSNRVITTTPAFSEYKIRGEVQRKEVIEIEYNKDFSFPVKEILKQVKKGDLVIVGNPNNPTGLRIPKEELIYIYKEIKKIEGYLVLDEAFFEFVPKDYDSIELFKEYEYENIGIIRAATKFFGIPGLRLGYGCMEEKIKKELENNSMTWSVNAFANLAGQYIFKQEEYIKKSKNYINGERNFLLSELNKISGLKPYPTMTNYILIKLLKKEEEEVFKALLNKGILVRKCSSFKTLGNDHIRVAIKDRERNIKLINSLKEIDLGV